MNKQIDSFSYRRIRVGIGQNSHRFLSPESSKPCIIGGVIFEGMPGLAADSDGDVVFHAICNAITSLTHVPILDKIAVDLCNREGITDSQVYLEKALHTLGDKRIEHLALSIEGKRPEIGSRFLEMRQKIASVLDLDIDLVGITTIPGDGLTDCGCGDGLHCFCTLTVSEGF